MIATLALRWLRRHRTLLLFELAGLFVFELGLVFIGKQFGGGPGLEPLIDMLPSFFQQLLHDKLRDFSSDSIAAMGFQHPVMVMVMCSVTALFATSPAADREEGLLELILCRPVSRRAYLLAVLIDVGALALLQPLVLLVAGQLGLQLAHLPPRLPFSAHLETALGLAALLLSVGGLALLLSVCARRRGVVVARLAGLLAPLYLVEFLGFLWSGIEPLRWLSPFHYVGSLPTALPAAVGMSSGSPWVLVGLFLVTTTVAVCLFERRDL